MKPDFNKLQLIPTIVCDATTKDVLMLAYVNEESYNLMLETGYTHFYSRSRQSLWKKGETSGHVQKVRGIILDCDYDTILVHVDQTGAACHTGAPSCFFNEVQPFDASNILHCLEKLIDERKINPIDNSYTNYLLDCGIDKVCKKIGEEASETIIAAKNNNQDELVGEIADLMYHLMVLMNIKEIKFSEVENLLKKRHMITGNKKEFNRKGEY